MRHLGSIHALSYVIGRDLQPEAGLLFEHSKLRDLLAVPPALVVQHVGPECHPLLHMDSWHIGLMSATSGADAGC